MSIDNNRLLMAVEQALREANRDIINPEFVELCIDDLAPVLKTVARARANYLKKLFEITGSDSGQQPNAQQIDELAALRRHYEELLTASQALHTAIERGYLDVKSGD